MKDSILILSGGVDSTTLLYDEQERIALAISFDYGSKHNAREIPFARLHCERLGIRHITIPLDFMTQYFVSSLLEGGEEIPEGHYADENMKSTVVPFRNGIMLSIAVGIAESNGLKYVMMANHGGDHTIYPDCRPEFVDAFDQAAASGTFRERSLAFTLYQYDEGRHCTSRQGPGHRLQRDVVVLQGWQSPLWQVRYLRRAS